MIKKKFINIAIIAHVDHGKTTLIDKLLEESGTLKNRNTVERIMDSNDIEKERGMTIFAKNTAIDWKEYHINIVDTPGHADFGGEVERIISMVDSVLLLVDAVEGPMPQTRFVTEKAFAHGLKPILVITKMDRKGARYDWVIDKVFDLFDNLGGTDDQMNFPIIYTSALHGYATLDPQITTSNMNILFETIEQYVEPYPSDISEPFQMQISSIDYSSFIGSMGIGRIKRGKIQSNTIIKIINKDGKIKSGRILHIFGYIGLERIKLSEAYAGDIICIAGIDTINISDTLCIPEKIEALPPLMVDEPTISMTFQVNDSPFSGKEGKFLTSRKINERLQKELLSNVALKVELLKDTDKFKVSGRGELHLSILLENMRREGFEIAVSRPEVILKKIDGKICEPYEYVIIEINKEYQGFIMENFGLRQGTLKNIETLDNNMIKLEFIVPSRNLIGFNNEFLNITSGTGIINKTFSHYGQINKIKNILKKRKNGTLISSVTGKALGFSLFNLQKRGKLFITHGTEVYEGMIIGMNSRSDNLTVNPCKGKQLTNMRASNKDESIILIPPISMNLEYALDFIDDDELVEITPKSIRIRKKILLESKRKYLSRNKN